MDHPGGLSSNPNPSPIWGRSLCPAVGCFRPNRNRKYEHNVTFCVLRGRAHVERRGLGSATCLQCFRWIPYHQTEEKKKKTKFD